MFSTRTRNRVAASIFAFTVVGLGAGVMGAGTAMADPVSFMDEITINGATLPGMTADQMIAAGYATCDHLRAGVSVLDEMSAVEQTYHFNQGTLFVSAATTNLCPNFAG
ncbi:DUF732 domain-containing protein [Antrihabitans cavernicola]|uniref:DUF732 domain-containing protein n=1 Tax=Antrihabitans cavernicola TaxID=2495913 RepID=A0A5A7S1E0_9NOCA|nr:DUF732 domain-containing protein [Spelaeibacter cavernicola]KAA0016774.1 DUF732 domain-containing protein [Spelaeibacter cavernicola]